MTPRWTIANIPPQHGRRAIVTGANSGIGYFTALELARAGGTVVVASRDPRKSEDAVARIRREVPSADVSVSALDLASLSNVRAFADRELALGLPLDLLINNAGVYAPPKRLETADRFELQFGTNVLGHFALTALLFPAVERAAARSASEPPRIVMLASIAHKFGQLHFTDLQYQGDYSPSRTYQQSKLADLMLAFELGRRLTARHARILSVAAHPGVAGTNLFQAGTYSTFERSIRRVASHAINTVLNSQVEGAIPTLYAATASGAQNGGYYGPQGWLEMRGGDVGPAKVAPQALDEAAAGKLWGICEELTGTTLLD